MANTMTVNMKTLGFENFTPPPAKIILARAVLRVLCTTQQPPQPQAQPLASEIGDLT